LKNNVLHSASLRRSKRGHREKSLDERYNKDMNNNTGKTRSTIYFTVALVLSALLTFSMCSCGVDTSSVAGNVSNASETPETASNDADGSDSAEDFLADIPDWSGYAFCYVNGNAPDFRPDEIWTSTQESLDKLDKLGRCGTASSCIGPDGMPTETRGDISSVEPTGWHTERYDFVEGEALYNRCHLIAHMLSGDDAVPRNLITGTSYMNRDGMLPFENAIAAYVRETKNHVMYRVTPVFVGDELLARGVHMEAVSVEDDGEGLAFNVFCYNVQPGVDIDYKTGDNKLSEDTTALEEYQAGKYAMMAATLGAIPSETGEYADSADQEGQVREYVLNTNTGRFHYPDCKSVGDMKDKNREDVEATREEILDRGFVPCGNCNP